MPRHEADLSTKKATEESDPRLPQAYEVARRAGGPEAASGQGAQAAHSAGAQQVDPEVRLTRTARLRRRREFLEVQHRGRRVFSGELLVLALDSGRTRARIGITVSSKVGNAVERNRVKRWIRVIWRELSADLPPLDLVVVARPAAKAAGLGGVRRAFEGALATLRAEGGTGR